MCMLTEPRTINDVQHIYTNEGITSLASLAGPNYMFIPLPCMWSRQCKSKQARDTAIGTPSHLLEWPRPRALTPPNAGEDAEPQGLGGSAGWGSRGRRQCGGFSYTTEHYLTVRSSSCAPWRLPKGAGDLRPREKLVTQWLTSSCVRNCPNLEETKLPLSR